MPKHCLNLLFLLWSGAIYSQEVPQQFNYFEPQATYYFFTLQSETIKNNHIKAVTVLQNDTVIQRSFYNANAQLIEVRSIYYDIETGLQYYYDTLHNIAVLLATEEDIKTMGYFNRYEKDKRTEAVLSDSSGKFTYEYDSSGRLTGRSYHKICHDPYHTEYGLLDRLFGGGSSLSISPYSDIVEQYQYDKKGRLNSRQIYLFEPCGPPFEPELVSNEIYKYRKKNYFMDDTAENHYAEFNTAGMKLNEQFIDEFTEYRYTFIYDSSNLLIDIKYEVYDLTTEQGEIRYYRFIYEFY